MMTVYCNAHNCIHCDNDEGECTRDWVTIEETLSMLYPAECTDYEEKEDDEDELRD